MNTSAKREGRIGLTLGKILTNSIFAGCEKGGKKGRENERYPFRLNVIRMETVNIPWAMGSAVFSSWDAINIENGDALKLN